MVSLSLKNSAFAFVAGLCLFGTASASAAVLFDDTNNGAVAIGLPANSSSLATSARGVAFTVGGSGMTLQSATFGIYGNSGGAANLGLRLYQGSNTTGTLLQTLAASSFSITTQALGGTLVTFNTGGWTLAANTQYFVAAFYGTAGSVTPRLGVSGLSSGSWSTNGLTFNQFAAATAQSDNYHIQLSGTINAGAVPATGVAALGGLGFAVGRRRRR